MIRQIDWSLGSVAVQGVHRACHLGFWGLHFSHSSNKWDYRYRLLKLTSKILHCGVYFLLILVILVIRYVAMHMRGRVLCYCLHSQSSYGF